MSACETCGAEIVGQPRFFMAPWARVCVTCFERRPLSLTWQIQAMQTQGIDPHEASRWGPVPRQPKSPEAYADDQPSIE